MAQPGNSGLRRTIRFTRMKLKSGAFKWPSVVFTLMREDDSEIGRLTVHGHRAYYTAPSAPQDEFRVKKSFWGIRWLYDQDGGQELGRIKYGWDLRPAITISGERFFLKSPPLWPFRRNKAGRPVQTATFTRADAPVLVMQSFAAKPLFTNEATIPLEGTISTNIDENKMIAVLLLFFQTFMEARHRTAA
jgi:hypothetical protein